MWCCHVVNRLPGGPSGQRRFCRSAALIDRLILPFPSVGQLLTVWIAASAVVFGGVDVAAASSPSSYFVRDGTTSDGSALAGVSCTSSTACIAVGNYYRVLAGYVSWTFAERWDGTRWSLLTTHDPLLVNRFRPTGSEFSGLSCSSSRACTAVGDYRDSSGRTVPLAERWDGTRWSTQPAPYPRGSTETRLYAVSCSSSTTCFAVGSAKLPGPTALVERWDGTRWSIQPSPTPPEEASWLSGVSCSSSTTCMTVGLSCCNVSGWDDILAEGWSGSDWSILAAPHRAGAIQSGLARVSCTSNTSCIAIGEDSDNGDDSFTLAERWDGTTWSIQPTPNPSGSSARLSGLSCTSDTSCIAVGDYHNDEYRSFTLAERWDGPQWSVQTTPTLAGATDGSLGEVSCESRMACIAVGSAGNRPLVERWDGATWTVQPTPTPIRAPTPGTARLEGIRSGCLGGPIIARINGRGISSVRWSLDGHPIHGRAEHRGTRYAASIPVSRSSHRLTIGVTFEASTQTHPRTFHRIVYGCPEPH